VREWPIPADSIIIGYFGNGKYLATVSYQNGFALSYWEASTGRLLRSIPHLIHPLNKRDFSPDGQYLAHVVRAENTWQLHLTELLREQPHPVLAIPLHDSMQKREINNVYLMPAWSVDSQRLIFRQQVNKQQTACLWDVPNQKYVFQQQTGIYSDPNIIVRFITPKNVYRIMNAATGQLIGEKPVLPTESEFEFSAEPNGSAFMIIGSTAQPPRLIKYRFDLKTLQLSSMWEKDLGSDNHHIRYETSLRPPHYFLFRPSPSQSILIHAGTGAEQDLPGNLPPAWSEKNHIGYVKASMGRGPGLEAVDGQGTRVISSDGRYLFYQTAEPVDTLLAKVKAWTGTKLGIKFDPTVSIVQFDLKQHTRMQHIDCNKPGPGTMILSPDRSRLSFLHKHEDQLYLRQWAVPFPTYPWLLMLLLSCLVGVLAQYSPGMWNRRRSTL
jgi:hypothetical protein